MELLSAGAAGTVTGSCHLLTIGGSQILVDCGVFQGPRALERRNREPFPFDPAGIDAVLLTHGHLDHVGRLPRLVAEGFRGPIYATNATRHITEVILQDAAKIAREDYERALRKAQRRGADGNEVPEPLYDDRDIRRTLELFVEPVTFGRPFAVGRVEITYQPAGHILGSAWIQLDDDHSRVVASGDLGNRESALQAPAAPPPECDVVLIESTYADRNHRSGAATFAEFREVIRGAVARGGNILVPSFALERSQQVLFALCRLFDAGDVDPLPVYLDSPMAITMTDLYRSCANEFRPEVQSILEAGHDPFDCGTVHYTRDSEDSKKINRITSGALIVAGSGMMTGGRILHHLRHNLSRPEACLVIVGYQAAGTFGRAIVGGARQVRIYGQTIPVRASVHTIGGFSAHADRDDLLAWLEPTGAAQVVLVHGEPEVMTRFEETLVARGKKVLKPELDQRYRL